MANIFDRYLIETDKGFCSFDNVVYQGFKKTIQIRFKNKTYITCTDDHRFNIDGTDVQAGKLKVGDFVDSKCGKLQITKIKKNKQPQRVYDVLNIGNSSKTFYANDILVHNCEFFGSSCTLIEGDTIEKIETIEPLEYRFKDSFSIYEKPIKGNKYVIGVDAAKGVGGDFSCLQVIKISSLTDIKQVAVYSSNTVSTTNFAQLCIEISKFYNEAELIIENNEVGWGIITDIYYNYEYPITNFSNDDLGIRSTKKSKLEANLALKKYMEDGWLNIVDSKTKSELSTYEEQTNGSFSCKKGQNDDSITALIWVCYYMESNVYSGPGSENDTAGLPPIDEKNRIEENYDPFIINDGTESSNDPEIKSFLDGVF